MTLTEARKILEQYLTWMRSDVDEPEPYKPTNEAVYEAMKQAISVLPKAEVEGLSFEVKGDFKELFNELMAGDGVTTIYIEKVNGELFPVANVERHPDCPKHIYEAWIRSLVQRSF